MLNFYKRKNMILTGILITAVVASSFLSINVFAKNVSNEIVPLPKMSTNPIINKTPSMASTFQPTRDVVPNTDKTIIVKSSHYIYSDKNAPTDKKKNYEDFCKTNNLSTNPSQTIYVRKETNYSIDEIKNYFK